MPADAPTIIATSGGRIPGRRTPWEVGPLTEHAVELSRVSGRRSRVCFLATAMGDSAAVLQSFYDAARFAGLEASHLALFPMPNVDDLRAHLLAQDVVWVWGGSVAGLLAMWRLHGLDDVMREAWQAGVVLTGVSAGSICWHVGGPTDSFGPDLQPVTNGLGLIPYANGVHYDSEEQRRPLYQKLIADGVLPAGYATDDGVGVLYRGTEMVEAVTEVPGKGAYFVERGEEGQAVETRIEPRTLNGAP
jgi:peptidase E